MTSELPAITDAWAAANEHIGGPPTERGVILPEIVTEDRVRRILTAALPALTAAAIAAEREARGRPRRTRRCHMSGVLITASTNPFRLPCGCTAWNEWVRTSPVAERVAEMVWQHREWHCSKHRGGDQ